MSVPRDTARHSDPELDGTDRPTRKIRRFASHSNLGEPHPGAGDPAHASVASNDIPATLRPFRLAAQSRWPATAGWSYGAARPARPLQRRDVAFLLGSLGLVLAFAVVASAVAFGPVVSLFSGTSPGPPIAAGTPIATSPPTANSPTTSATFAALDTTTLGNWQKAYGSAGYLIAGDRQQLPASIRVTPSGTTYWEWAKTSTQARALVKPGDSHSRIAACWYTSTTLAFDVNITDGHAYQVALYALDFNEPDRRVETVSVVDPGSGRMLDTRQLRTFSDGEYLVWQVRGHVNIQVTNGPGSTNAVVSGLFFAPATSAAPA